jgi:hypothetical protein
MLAESVLRVLRVLRGMRGSRYQVEGEDKGVDALWT